MGMRLDLQKLYSSGPEAVAVAGKNKIGLKDEWTFWSALKSKGLTEFNPRVLEVVHAKGMFGFFCGSPPRLAVTVSMWLACSRNGRSSLMDGS